MFQHVKQYRQRYGLTQEALGELIGMNPKFIYCLEKNRARVGDLVYTPQEAKVLHLLFGDTPKTPDFFHGLPTITGQDLIDIRKARKLTQEQAGEIIGISGCHWGTIEAGKSKEDLPHVRRWYTLLLMANLPEYFQAPTLTPAPEAPMVETPNVASVVPNVACEPAMLPANVASDDFADQPGLIPFAYGPQKVRMKMIDGNPWFMLSDVCRAIGYQSVEHASKLVREDALQKVQFTDSLNRVQFANFISESGLYQFLTRARVPAVEPFQDWVFDEVLPTIRKTGGYAVAPAQIDPIDAAILSLQRIKQIEAQQAQLTATIANQSLQIEQLKQQGPVDIDKAALHTLQKLQALEARRNELQNLVAQVVNAADQSKHIIASNYCSYQSVWRAVFNASNPPVNKLAGYTSLAQINTGISAAKQLLETLQGKPIAEQLKIEIEGDAA